MSRRPVPLMFIQSPFVIQESSAEEEEETIVRATDTEEVEEIIKTADPEPAILSSVENQLTKITSPFGRHLYQPVRVKRKQGEDVFGVIDKVENAQLFIRLTDTADQVVAVSTAEILDILWRGKSIPEK